MNSLPKFLCVGMQKAGTSWLYDKLRQHPGIWLPPIKELHFFDHLYCPDNRAWTQWHLRVNARNLIKTHLDSGENPDFGYIRYVAGLAAKPLFTEGWYRQAFRRPAANGKILGDITPEYCAIGETGIAHVRRLLGDVKIIWLIRDPMARALSQIRMNAARSGIATEAITEAQWLALAQAPEIRQRGDYADYLPLWTREFGQDGMLFLPFGDLAGQPLALLRRVEQFLALPGWDGYPNLAEKVHATQPLAVPEALSAQLQVDLKSQYDFLHGYFPASFIAAI